MNNKLVNKETAPQRDSFGELLGQLALNSATVVHDEIELFTQSIREKVKAGRNGVIALVIGASISYVAFICLCLVLIVGLTSYMALIMAALLTGVILALIGGTMLFIGYRKLKKLTHKT